MRSAIGKVHVTMIRSFTPEEVCEIKRISGPQCGFEVRAVLAFMRFDKRLWPSSILLRFFFPNPQNRRWRRILYRGTQMGKMRVTKAGERRMDRADDKLEAAPL